MTREIKFNAVDTDRNIVYKYNEWFEEEETEEFHNENLGKFLDQHYGCELLQYTGLKDKNGKEIYESDIVKIEKCFTNGIDKLSDHIGEIKYINDRYYAVDEYMNCLSPYEYRNSIEVIGNIYENPELLKGVIND